MNEKISLYGSSGFIGENFNRMYGDCIKIARNSREPLSNKILYFISTTDNYNIHDNITLDIETNLKILCEVLDYCRSEDITFNFISSWFVYGKTPELPAKENSECNPTGFYSITKHCAEQLIKSFAETYGMKYRILRLCNVLGSGDNKFSKKKNAITWIINEMKDDRDVTLYDGGEHYRDVMHVEDVCRAIKLVMDDGELNQIYNIGSGIPTSIGQIIQLAHKHLESKSKIIDINPPNFHSNVQTKNFWMNTDKLKSLGFEQKINLESIVKDLC
jgi:nucleoside-diphosphate-sugar epimerase|tara:strand:+ start:1179 stop:2000 length:822 start_codon:yes stop_codon:yes gene_type:complete